MKYFLDFSDRDQMMHEFSDYNYTTNTHPTIEGFPTDEEILFASYAPGFYCGGAVVLFGRDGKLFMVEASHCSCYGLEGQWDPNEVVPEQVLRYELDDDHGHEVKTVWAVLGSSLNKTQ